MSRPLVIIGGGGFGRETLDVIEAINRARPESFAVLGVVDDAPTDTTLERLRRRGVEWLGGIDAWLASADDALYVIGIGNPRVRCAIVDRLAEAGRQAATLVHPRAAIGSAGSLGEGTVVCSGVEISTNVTIGRHVHVNPSATVGHDAILADFVSVNPAAVISGEVTVEREALIGAGAVVLQSVRVGGGATVGASACVTRDVSSGATVKGVPAR